MLYKNITFAHRGIYNNIDIPENSAKAFEMAIKKNENIELDVQLTKDNILIVFHDENLKRMTGINKNICDCTYDELKNLKLINTKFSIPKFNDILKLINGKVILNIEIKKTNKVNLICKNIVKELSNYNSNFIIQSFSPKIIKWFSKNKPDYTRGLLIKENIYNSFLGNLLLFYCKPNFLAISKKFINKHGINKTLKKYPILIWTIKKYTEINKNNKFIYGYICDNI